MLGLIKRTCKGLDDPTTLRSLYCSLLCSNLEYCSVVWSPYTKRNIDKLERGQRRATKLILKCDDHLMSLEKRRWLTDVTFLYKVLKSNEGWSSQLWTQFNQLRREAWKKFRTSTGFEPVTSRYRCMLYQLSYETTFRLLYAIHNCEDHPSFDFISAVP